MIAGKIVLPAALILETVCRAASLGFPGLSLDRYESAEFTRFIELDAKGGTSEVFIGLSPGPSDKGEEGVCEVKVYTQFSAGGRFRRKKVHHSGRLFFGHSEPSTPTRTVEDDPGAQRCLTRGRVYPDYVDLGPAFQTLEGVFLVGNDEIRAEVELREEAVQSSPTGSALPGPILLRDGCFQLPCVWGRLGGGEIRIPSSFGSFHSYRSIRGRRVGCRAVSAGGDEKERWFDLDIFDEDRTLLETYRRMGFRRLFGA